jgi:type II secretory pathway pseudopilin PulG
MSHDPPASVATPRARILNQSGFSLPELLVSCLMLLLLAGTALGLLTDVERVAGRQADLQSARAGSLLGLDAARRLLQQSGNNPCVSSRTGIMTYGPGAWRLQSDLTGSAAPSYPDKGDPDGDNGDSFEDIVIRHDASADTLGLESIGGGVQTVADGVIAFSLRFFDASGTEVTADDRATRAQVEITAVTRSPDPRTRRNSAIQLSSDVALRAHPKPARFSPKEAAVRCHRTARALRSVRQRN